MLAKTLIILNALAALAMMAGCFAYLAPSFCRMDYRDAACVGIIGSSDGPTAIYTSATPTWIGWVFIFLLCAFFIANAIVIRRLSKPKNS